MLTRPIFIQPDSELIRETVCACAKLFVDVRRKCWMRKNQIVVEQKH